MDLRQWPAHKKLTPGHCWVGILSVVVIIIELILSLHYYIIFIIISGL